MPLMAIANILQARVWLQVAMVIAALAGRTSCVLQMGWRNLDLAAAVLQDQLCSEGGLNASPAVQVAAPMGETFCVLQMPRGNLEVVSPRALVLAAIADALLVSAFAQSLHLPLCT